MQLPEKWDLPARVRLRVGKNSSGRQRAIVEEGHVLLILHRVPRYREDDRETVFFWRRPEGSWACSTGGSATAQLRRHLYEYEETEERLAACYASAQRAADYFRVLEELVPLKRAARNMYAALQQAREATTDDLDLIDLRNAAGDIDRSMELLLHDTKNALDFDIARTTEEQAHFSERAAIAGHRLNVLAALFFPVTAIASILGMNLRTGIEEAPVWVSWLVIVGGMGLGWLLCSWLVRHRNDRSG